MIDNQAETYINHFKFKYRDIPIFSTFYNKGLNLLKENNDEPTYDNIDIILRELRNMLYPNVTENHKEPDFYIVDEFRGDGEQLERKFLNAMAVRQRWHHVGALILDRDIDYIQFIYKDRLIKIIRTK